MVESRRGRLVRAEGERLLATFDGPGRAIRCATGARDAAAGLGIRVRAGVHTGQAEITGQDVAGVCVDMTERVAGLARPGEILVTRTVKDLVVGSGIEFAGRGSHRIGGTAGPWRLFAVTGRDVET